MVPRIGDLWWAELVDAVVRARVIEVSPGRGRKTRVVLEPIDSVASVQSGERIYLNWPQDSSQFLERLESIDDPLPLVFGGDRGPIYFPVAPPARDPAPAPVPAADPEQPPPSSLPMQDLAPGAPLPPPRRRRGAAGPRRRSPRQKRTYPLFGEGAIQGPPVPAPAPRAPAPAPRAPAPAPRSLAIPRPGPGEPPLVGAPALPPPQAPMSLLAPPYADWVTGDSPGQLIEPDALLVAAPGDDVRACRPSMEKIKVLWGKGFFKSQFQGRAKTGNTTVGDWAKVLEKLLRDDRARTFNALCLEASGLHAKDLEGSPAEEAIWLLIGRGQVEHTRVAPVFLRQATGLAFEVRGVPQATADPILGQRWVIDSSGVDWVGEVAGVEGEVVAVRTGAGDVLYVDRRQLRELAD